MALLLHVLKLNSFSTMAQGQKRWVVPDFNSIESSHPSSNNKQNKRVQFCSSKQSGVTTGLINSEDSLLINKCKPQSSSELVVQKKKISEVKEWLILATTGQARLLLLKGPPGCGKFQTLTLLCKELDILLVEWDEPMKHQSESEWAYKKYTFSDKHSDRITDESAFTHLQEFLCRSNRYNTLNIVTNNHHNGGLPNSSSNKKILLIKDLSPFFSFDAEKWNEMLKEYCQIGKTPVVFILTEEHSNQGKWMKLFPNHLNERLPNISTINFNALANTFITKVLQRVISSEQILLPPSCEIAAIVEKSHGDLRSALNTLQWISQSRETNNKAKNVLKRKLLTNKTIKADSTLMSERDGSLDFLHALGKVLYCKRSNLPEELPDHLLKEKRNILQENIGDLSDKIGEPSSKVLLYLHHNYPPFFSHIEDAANATHYLCVADVISDRFGNKEVLDECALLTAVYGFMHSNTEVQTSGFRPLKKSDDYELSRKQQDIRKEAQYLWPLHHGKQFFIERLPYICHILTQHSLKANPERTQKFISEVAFLPSRNLSDQLKRFEGNSSLLTVCHQIQALSNESCIATEENDEEIVIEEFDD